jgi:hypothetical protein
MHGSSVPLHGEHSATRAGPARPTNVRPYTRCPECF